MQEKYLLILFVFFIFSVFLVNNSNISGKASLNIDYGFCSDNDHGIKPFTPGYVKSDIGTFNDRCSDNSHQIREYYCNNERQSQVTSKVINCGSGYMCRRDVLDNADACMKS